MSQPTGSGRSPPVSADRFQAPALSLGAAPSRATHLVGQPINGSIGTALASSIIIQPNGLPAESGFTDTFLLLSAFAAAAVVLSPAIPSVRRVRPTIPEPVLEDAVS